jgi:hypothetical protein
MMAKLWTVVMVVGALLLVAPVIESGTSHAPVFQAVGNACDGGGGGW